MKTIAALISYFLSPPLLLIALFFLYLTRGGYTYLTAGVTTAMITAITVIPFIVALMFLKRKKYISDYDVRRREERPLVLVVALLCSVLSIAYLYFIGPRVLFNLSLLLFLWISLFATITLFWKVSGHVAAVTLFMLMILYQSPYLPIGILLIILVAWSRLYRKNHTLPQVIGGFFLSIVVVIFGLMRHII